MSYTRLAAAFLVVAALTVFAASVREEALQAGAPAFFSVAAAQGRWEQRAPMPEMPRFYAGVAAARGQLFVVGGRAPGESDGPERFAVHAYDPETNRWERLPSLPVPMIMPNVAGLGDDLYVLGALNVNETFTFDFDQRAWLPRTPLPVPRLGSAAVGIHGATILLAGGVVPGRSANDLNTGVRQSTLLAYDTVRDSWEELPELPVAVGYAAGAVLENEFWVMGGSTDRARTNQVLAYDVTARTWSSKAPLPVSLSSSAFASIGHRIYVTGGITTGSGAISSNTRVFDTSTDLWTTLAPLPTPRFAMQAAVIDDRLYVPAGAGMGADPGDPLVALPNLEVFIP